MIALTEARDRVRIELTRIDSEAREFKGEGDQLGEIQR